MHGIYERIAFAALVSPWLAACGGAEPPAAAPQGGPAGAKAGGAAGDCATKEACYESGRRAEASGDRARAKASYDKGCDLGDGESCNEAAVKFAADPAQKAALGLKACELGSGAGCFNQAEETRKAGKEKEAVALYEKSCLGTWKVAGGKPVACRRGSVTAFRGGDVEAAARMSQAVCNDEFTEGCGVLGVLYVQGRGVAADEAKGKELLHRACAKGDEDACSNEKKLGAAPAAPSDVAGANLTVASASSGGLAITDVACKTPAPADAAAAGPAIAAALAKKKPALDACAPGGGQARVRWTASGGKVSQAEAKSGDAKVEACVAKALKGLAGAPDGVCAATVPLGKP
jgi:hypothetical protein